MKCSPARLVKALALFVLLAFQAGPLCAQEIDFSQYRPGFNNRELLRQVVAELVGRYKNPVIVAYGPHTVAKDGKIVLGEEFLDHAVKGVSDPQSRRAIITLIIAHEYFHALLDHAPQASKLFVSGLVISPQAQTELKMMEKQADYLAARHLRTMNLPLRPVEEFILKNPDEFGGPTHPTAEEKVAVIRSAESEAFRTELFPKISPDCGMTLSDLQKALSP